MYTVHKMIYYSVYISALIYMNNVLYIYIITVHTYIHTWVQFSVTIPSNILEVERNQRTWRKHANIKEYDCITRI